MRSLEMGLPIFWVPESRRNFLYHKLEKLSTKARKISDDVVIRALILDHEERPTGIDLDGPPITFYKIVVQGQVPTINGWQFVARLQWDEQLGKNMVFSLPTINIDVPVKYIHSGPACDHCKQMRRRTKTYLLRYEDDGQLKQVGSTCLKAFTQEQTAESIAKIAEYILDARSQIEAVEQEGQDDYQRAIEQPAKFDLKWIHLLRFLEYTAAEIEARGFLSRTRAVGGEATADYALQRYRDMQTTPTQANMDTAKAALLWIRAQRQVSDDKKNDYLLNLETICENDMISVHHIGYVASLIRTCHMAQVSNRGGYIGQIGDACKVDVICVGNKSFQSRSGVTLYANVYEDQAGNRYVLFSRFPGTLRERYVGRLKIRAHDTYRGGKQNVMAWYKDAYLEQKEIE